MERITCYKLCYALGVSQHSLQSEFLIEHRIASYGDTFCPGKNLKKFRALSAVYFLVMNNYKDFVDRSQFQRKMRNIYSDHLSELDYDPVSSRGMLPLLNYLQDVVVEHNDLVSMAYEELETVLPFDLFCTLTLLPELTASRAAQISFLMSNTGHSFGLYFFGHELLNVALGSMLQDDMSLRDRLSLFAGQSLGSLHDRSELALSVDRYLRGVFVKTEQLEKLSNLVYYCGDRRQSEVREFVHKLPDGVLPREVTSEEELQPGMTCMTGDSRWVYSVVRRFPDVDFAVLLPVESRYYKSWRSRRVPNIYLISQR